MNKEFQMKLLSLIERDSKLSEAELAQMLACDTASVHAALTGWKMIRSFAAIIH